MSCVGANFPPSCPNIRILLLLDPSSLLAFKIIIIITIVIVSNFVLIRILLLLAPSSLLALKMDLYYESLCPDSTRFISNQVAIINFIINITINIIINIISPSPLRSPSSVAPSQWLKSSLPYNLPHHQIPEMWAALSQEVSINFVPYGFASVTFSTDLSG